MSDERKVKRWITVNGRHIPLYEDTKDWMSADMKARYSSYIDRPDLYNKLDSDEKTWVEALRAERLEQADKQKEQQIQRNKEVADELNKREKELKPWSKSEEKRTEAMSKFISSKLRAGSEWGEFYEENELETLDDYTYVIRVPGFKDNEVTLTKMNLIYAQNWDENDNRVKRGKAVTGSTYYTVQDSDGAIMEDKFAYKTKEDAIHSMKLHIKELEDWYKRRSK